MIPIECRDALVDDVKLNSFKMELDQFPGTKFSAGKAQPHNGKDGPCTLFYDPLVTVDETKSNPDDVRKFIESSGIFALRHNP